MEPDVFLQVMVPLIEMKGAVLIMISTLVDKFNFYTKLLYLVDPATNRPAINTYVCELVCASCKRRKDPTRCRHMLHLIPKWKNPAKLGVVALLYGAEKALMARESMGIISDDASSWFASRHIEHLMGRDTFSGSMYLKPPWVMITCDPNAGGSNGLSFTAMVYHNGQYVVRPLTARRARCAPRVPRMRAAGARRARTCRTQSRTATRTPSRRARRS